MTRQSRAALLVFATLTLSPTSTAFADNWPRFHGPNGTGIAHDKDVPVEWDDKHNVLWKVSIPGLGHSSPVVWGDRLFVQSASTDGKERLLLCINVKNGETLWTRTVNGFKAPKHAKNSLASATPSTDGKRVYSAFWNGAEIVLAAFDMDGNPLWSRNLGTWTSEHGPGASPVVYEDKVYFANDQDGISHVLALDAATGDTRWKLERKAYRACYSAPFLLHRFNRKSELIVGSTAGLTAYDPDNGAEIWKWTWPWPNPKKALRTTGSPVFGNGMIYHYGGEGQKTSFAVAVPYGEKGDVPDQAVAWRDRNNFPYVPSAIYYRNHLYFVNDRGDAGCYDAKTGKRIWQERLQGSFSSSPVLIDGKLYACNEDGDVYVLAAEPVFRILARNTVGERTVASPAVSNNRLFIRTDQHLICIAKDRRSAEAPK
jgi:outer membrane protein assembly factor BamB